MQNEAQRSCFRQYYKTNCNNTRVFVSTDEQVEYDAQGYLG